MSSNTEMLAYTVLQMQQQDATEYIWLVIIGLSFICAVGCFTASTGVSTKVSSMVSAVLGVPLAIALMVWVHTSTGKTWRCVYQVQDNSGVVQEKQHRSKFDCVKPGNVVYLPASK